MRQRRSVMSVVEAALTKALGQVELARSAAQLSDEDLAEAVARVAAELRRLRNDAAGKRANASNVRLSERTNRTRSYLAAEAIEAYVARESEILEGIGRGLEDMKANRLVPHDEAMAELDAAIEDARGEQK